MFDANMRGVPLGKKFFAEALDVPKTSAAFHMGFREGEVYIAYNVKEIDEEMISHLYLPEEGWKMVSEEEETSFLSEPLFIYAGEVNGDGFISESSRDKARKVFFTVPRLEGVHYSE